MSKILLHLCKLSKSNASRLTYLIKKLLLFHSVPHGSKETLIF